MKDVFAKRLRSARLRAGISQDQLVTSMDGLVSKNSISKYEKGLMMANVKVLIALAKALGVKTDYFFRPFTIEIKNVEFRKKSKLSVKDINSIKQKVTDDVEKYIEIEQFLNIKTDFKNPLSKIPINSKSKIEEAVNTLRKEWKLGLNAFANVIDLLEDREVKVIEVVAPEAFDGFSGWADNRIPIIVVNKGYTVERKRLTTLHELGYLLLTFDSAVSQKEVEKYCFQFAGAMLMPEKTFKREIGTSRSSFSQQELIAIKEIYGISIQAIMARAKDLEIISEFHYISFRKKINRNRTEEGLGQYKGNEQSYRFMQLVYRAASEGVISLSKAANLSSLKLAEFRKQFVAL